jgi:hypothetical protein
MDFILLAMVERRCDLKMVQGKIMPRPIYNAEAKRARLSADHFHVLQSRYIAGLIASEHESLRLYISCSPPYFWLHHATFRCSQSAF